MHQQEDLLIKIIKLVNGDDIICIFPKEQPGPKSALVRLNKPLQIKFVPQLTTQGIKDYVALVKWTSYSNDDVVTIPKDKIVTITSATDDIKQHYTNIARNYHLIESSIKNKTAGTAKIEFERDDEMEEALEELEQNAGYSESKKTIH
jgi:hypothetical protein